MVDWLDDEHKTRRGNELMVVLCGESDAPALNTPGKLLVPACGRTLQARLPHAPPQLNRWRYGEAKANIPCINSIRRCSGIEQWYKRQLLTL